MFVTIGLEIHLKLNSKAKIFCQCKNEQNFDSEANQHICPVCTGQPGALPLLNKEVVEKTIIFGRALNARVNEVSSFDRKNYFYPDLPMGFQITQFYHPIITKGQLSYFINDYEEEKTVGISEAHLECDTAKMIHSEGKSLIDFDRAGTPLLEIVTDPDFTSAEEAVEYAREIQRIAKWNNLGDADLEKGQMRVDVNISIRKTLDDPLGTRVELKNINTFSAMKRAIEGEYQRQKELLEGWGRVDQETRRWVDAEGTSFSMRSKESAIDYRYFPEPDMPVLDITPFMKGGSEWNEQGDPEILRPFDWIKQCKEEFWFHKEYINALLLDKQLFEFFFAKVDEGFDPKTVAKWMVGPMKWALDYVQGDEISLRKNVAEEAKKLKSSPEELLAQKTTFLQQCDGLEDFLERFSSLFDGFLKIEQAKKLVDNQLKIVFEEVLQSGSSAAEIVKAKGFDAPVMEGAALVNIVKEVLEINPAIVAEYKGGKEGVLGFFVGQVMKRTWGKVNPQEVADELRNQLK